MVHQFFLLRELVHRDFESRYAGSLLGFLWPFLVPIWQLVLFTFVFSTVLKIPLIGERTDSFGIFLFCGLLPWMAFHEGIMRSATAITDNASLVKHVRFQPEVLVLAVVLAGVLQELVALAVFLVVLAGLGQLAPANLPLLLIALPLQIGLTLGLGFLTCSFHTFFRDTAQMVPMLLMGLFYVTPIVYPLGLLGERYQAWLRLNPLTTLVGLYRQALLEGDGVSFEGLGSLVATTVVLLALGGWLFRRSKPAFADEI